MRAIFPFYGDPARSPKIAASMAAIITLFHAAAGRRRAGELRMKLNSSSAHFAAAQRGQQDAQFARAFEVLRNGVADHAFPGAVTAITHRGSMVALQSVGRFTYDPASPAVTTETIFDLASVSKVVATTAMAMLLYESGKLHLEAALAYVCKFVA